MSELIADTEKMLSSVNVSNTNTDELEISGQKLNITTAGSDIDVSSSEVSDILSVGMGISSSSSNDNDIKIKISSSSESSNELKEHDDSSIDHDDSSADDISLLKSLNKALLNAGLPVYRFKNLNKDEILKYFTDVVTKMSKSHDELLLLVDELNEHHLLAKKNSKKL